MEFKATERLFIRSTKDSTYCLTKLMPSILISGLLTEHLPHFLTKHSLIHCPYAFSISLLDLLHIWYPLWPHIHLSSCLPQSISILQRATSDGEKFLSQIKWTEIKMLPQHVPCLVTLKEIGPLAALTGAPQFPKTTRTQFDCIQYWHNKAGWLNESQTQFSYLRQLEQLQHLTLSLPPPAVTVCLNKLPYSFSKDSHFLSLPPSFPHTHVAASPCPSCFVLDLESSTLFQSISSAWQGKLCVKIEIRLSLIQ